MSTHHCFSQADELLKTKNTKLSFAMQIPSGQERLVIATEKVGKGPKPVLMLARFCPFCGEKLDDEQTTQKRAVARSRAALR